MKFHLGFFLTPKLSYSFCILLVQTYQGKTYKFTNFQNIRTYQVTKLKTYHLFKTIYF